MRMNELKPTPGSRKSKQRVGRGIGSGSGKTAKRGHKGQKSRSGGLPRVGFEGGQMPLQRRIPKFGFRSRVSKETAEIRLHELGLANVDVVDIAALRAANIITANIKRAKVIASGEIKKAITVKGLKVTKGAREAITAAGGKVEE